MIRHLMYVTLAVITRRQRHPSGHLVYLTLTLTLTELELFWYNHSSAVNHLRLEVLDA